jgi:hypothetical protein
VEAEGGWLTLHRPEPALAAASLRVPAQELLARTAELPGNWRYVHGPGRSIELLGEVPWPGGEDGLEVARLELGRLTGSSPRTQAVPAPEAVEAALEGSGVPWCSRDEGWAVPATQARPWELRVRPVPGGVRVETILAEWDEEDPVEVAALARFLAAAQAALRFARCELGPHSTRVVSLAETSRLETDLPHSLRAVAAGCGLLVREVRALLVPEAARRYLAFHAGMPASAPGPAQGGGPV